MKNRKHLLDGDLETIAIDVTEQPIERPTKGQRLTWEESIVRAEEEQG